MTTEKPAAPLSTSDGARCYIAHFFAREMRRHDFTTYIATELAADFACALAQYLAARQPGAQEPVGFQIMRRSADDTCFNGRWDNPPSGFHDDREYYVSRPGTFRIRDIYAAPPAQGIDLEQLRKLADRWERTANDKDVAFKDRELIGMYDMALNKCVRELRAALIDGQRDAAPGAGSRTDHLLDRRNRLMNSYGNGDREDAALDEQIAKIDAELAGSQRDVATGVGNG